jgi:hypothetical protein
LLLKKLDGWTDVGNSIDNSITNLVFYDKCIVKISPYFEDKNKRRKETVINGIDLVAIYQNNELTVSLQINNKIKVATSIFDTIIDSCEINFDSNTVLISDKYKVDDKYDISQSHLYSVIVSAGDYTIISEPNIDSFVLYYKNKAENFFESRAFGISNLGDILYIKPADKRIIIIEKDILNKPNKLSKCYIDGGNSYYIEVIDTDVVRDLLLDSISESNNTNWVGIDINDKVKRMSLKDKSEEIIRHHFCFSNDLEVLKYAYHIDYKSEEFYALVFFRCSNEYKFYLFKDKIENLYRKYGFPRLLSVSYAKGVTSEVLNIFDNLDKLTTNDYDYERVLQLCDKKWNTGYGSIDLRIFKMYDKKKRYYDHKYYRVSITIAPQESSLFSTLHLVRRIMLTF